MRRRRVLDGHDDAMLLLAAVIVLLQCLRAQVMVASSGATEMMAMENALGIELVDAEITATVQLVDHLRAKATLLQRMAHVLQQDGERGGGTSNATYPRVSPTHSYVGTTAPTTPSAHFTDWLAEHSIWELPESSELRDLHVEMISFRLAPGVARSGKKGSSRKPQSWSGPDAAPMAQFLLIVDKRTGRCDLFDPVTKALRWQHWLALPTTTSIHRVIFHSERSAQLLVITTTDMLIAYKLRVYHGRRQIAGDHRRPNGKDAFRCMWRSGPTLVSEHMTLAAPHPLDDDAQFHGRWRTVTPAGTQLHMEFEHVFTAQSPVGGLEHLAFVHVHQGITLIASGRASTSGGSIAFFDGVNGTFLSELPRVDHGDGIVTTLTPLSAGIVAVAAGSDIGLVDAIERRWLPLICHGTVQRITSLEKDTWRHNVLYAGTDGGRGLVFRITRFGELKRNNGLMALGSDADVDDLRDPEVPTCAITSQLVPRHDHLWPFAPRLPRAVLVKALPGYLVLATARSLVIYETTSGRVGEPLFLAERPCPGHDGDRPVVVSHLSGANELHVSPMAVAVLMAPTTTTTTRRASMVLLAPRMPPPMGSFELGWIRGPMMLLCALGVMFWQQARFRRPPGSSGASDEVDGFLRSRFPRADWPAQGLASTNPRTRRF